MELKTELIRQASSYCAEAEISKARLATIVANDGKFFARIEGGGGLTVRMYDRFQRYFREHPANSRPKASKRKFQVVQSL